MDEHRHRAHESRRGDHGRRTRGLTEMVTSTTLMTMSGSRWSIATAKAEFSRLVLEARTQPQVIENRGRAVAVVVSSEEYRRLAQNQDASERWRAVLELSAEIREEGGATLAVTRRRARRSPLGRSET